MKTDIELAMRVSINSMLINFLLSAFKLVAGIVAHSSALISDAIHSASDVFSTVIVMIGIKISTREADEGHPYGHERMECVAAILLGISLCMTGVIIGVSGGKKILQENTLALKIPGKLALFAAFLSIVVKEGMYWYTRNVAKRIDSTALLADAWHHRSDAFSSIGSLLGVAGARLGFFFLDPLTSIVICIFIIKTSYDIFKDAIRKMTDEACENVIEQKMRYVILQVTGVKTLDLLKTRKFGSKVYVDVEIGVDEWMRVKDAHEIAERVHAEIEKQFPFVKHCMVHVNPK